MMMVVGSASTGSTARWWLIHPTQDNTSRTASRQESATEANEFEKGLISGQDVSGVYCQNSIHWFDSKNAGVLTSARRSSHCSLYLKIWVPREPGRIGKRVRLPRGRATVMRLFACHDLSGKRSSTLSQETCPRCFAAFERPRKAFRPPGFEAIFKSRRPPVAFRKGTEIGGTFAETTLLTISNRR